LSLATGRIGFAEVVANLAAMPLELARFDHTNFYVCFELGRAFDRHHPIEKTVATADESIMSDLAWRAHAGNVEAHEGRYDEFVFGGWNLAAVGVRPERRKEDPVLMAI
jgi:hypothetical protein